MRRRLSFVRSAKGAGACPGGVTSSAQIGSGPRCRGLVQRVESCLDDRLRWNQAEAVVMPDRTDGRSRFAEGDLEAGFRSFFHIVDTVISSGLPPHCRQVLAEFSMRMREFGASRPGYIVLVVLVLELYAS